jgi:hypothetical protein
MQWTMLSSGFMAPLFQYCSDMFAAADIGTFRADSHVSCCNGCFSGESNNKSVILECNAVIT